MKSVLISIQPKWCEKIAQKIKTIEVRKTRPKLETPFVCYIYATIGVYRDIRKSIPKEPLFIINNEYEPATVAQSIEHTKLSKSKWHLCNGKVIGEFICDWIKEWKYLNGIKNESEKEYWILAKDRLATCLTYNEVENYGKGKTLYGWYISDLKIYDEPKELSEFRKPCPFNEDCDLTCSYALSEYHGDGIYGDVEFIGCGNTLTRPAVSWCYVEEI